MRAIDHLQLGSGTAFDRRTGAGYRLNPCAALVLAGLQSGRSMAAIGEEIAARFPDAAPRIAADLERFAERCRELGYALEDQPCAR